MHFLLSLKKLCIWKYYFRVVKCTCKYYIYNLILYLEARNSPESTFSLMLLLWLLEYKDWLAWSKIEGLRHLNFVSFHLLKEGLNGLKMYIDIINKKMSIDMLHLKQLDTKLIIYNHSMKLNCIIARCQSKFDFLLK